MKRPILALILFFLAALPAWSQSTTVTVNVTDAGSQAWSNGTYQFQLVPDPQYPNLPSYTWTGGTLPLFINGSLNGSGSASVSVPSNSAITPGTSKWQVQVCPAATAKCYLGTPVVITGATQTVNLTPPAISITISNPPVNLVSAYADAEITSTPLGANYFNLTSSVTRTCTAVTGTTCNTWANAGGASSGVSSVTASAPLASSGGATPNITSGTLPNSPSESSAYTFFLSSTSNCLSPSFTGTTVCARNNQTSAIDYSGTDAVVVVNSAITNLASTCGTFFFKNGIYPMKSATLESSSTNILQSGSLYYGITFPANAGSTNQYCQWRFIGEQAPYEAGTATQTQGVIFQATAAIRTAAVSTSNMLAYFWHRPDTTNQIGNDVFFQNIGFQGVDNQRGNECVFCEYEAGTVDFYNTTCQLAPNWGSPTSPTISPAVAGTNRNICFTSTQNNRNNWQRFVDTWAEGADICYDVESEHSVTENASALLCTNAAIIGRLTQSPSHPIVHPGNWTKFTDQENINGITFGANVGQGNEFSLLGYDIEQLTSTSFARSSNLTETNCNYSSGLITYRVVNAGVGVSNNANLFNSVCGNNFTALQGNATSGLLRPIMSDPFTHPNATSLGPGWQTLSNATNYPAAIGIVSNTAAIPSCPSGCATAAASVYIATNPNADQFSQATASACDTLGVGLVLRDSSGAGTTLNHYRALVLTAGGGGHFIQKFVANTKTTIATNASATCAAGDKFLFRAIGSTLQLWQLHSGTWTLTASVVDTSLTSGNVGVVIGGESSPGNTDGLTNWSGGSLPTQTGSDSISGTPFTALSYGTVTNCAAVGTAASPSVASCGSAPAGHFSCATNATGATCTVNTTAVTANSEIFVFESDTTVTGTALGVTCNTSTTVNPTTRLLASSIAGTSFTINLGTVTTNPACFSYHILN